MTGESRRTWIYNNTNRSTLSAVLLHFMVNLGGELFGLTEQAHFHQALLIVGLTAVVTVIWGPRTMIRDEGRVERAVARLRPR